MALRSLISRSPSAMASLSSLLSARGFSSKPFPLPPLTHSSTISKLRPLSSVLWTPAKLSLVGDGLRRFSTRPTTSSLNDPSPNWSNRPPKETILLDGCDFEHWLVVMEPPQGEPTRDEIIDSYIKTLAQVVGSDDEARMKIYSVSTKHYFAFGALVSEELSYKIKELPNVRWVLPDSYLDVKNKDYGGEPFIDGKAVPYDPKYHEEWVRNNARANERSRRNDRPRNFDRSRNFERRRENMQSRDFQGQGPMSGPPPPPPPPPGPNPYFQGAPFQNQGPPPSPGGYTQHNQPPLPHQQYSSGPPPPPPGAPYQNQGPAYQANYPPNSNAPGGNAYQGGGTPYQPSGSGFQGGGGGYQPGGGNFQGGGGPGNFQGGGNSNFQGGGGGYQPGGGGYQSGGGNFQGGGGGVGGVGGGYPRQENGFQQGGGGGNFQARDVPGRD